MAWSDILYFTPVIIGGLGFVASKLPDMIDAFTGGDQALFERFQRDARQRGLDHGGMSKEWSVRTVFAQLRTEASAAVMADLENWQEALDRTVDATLKANPQHVAELKGMLTGLSYGHILYEHEAKAVDNLYHKMAREHQTLNHHARTALKVV